MHVVKGIVSIGIAVIFLYWGINKGFSFANISMIIFCCLGGYVFINEKKLEKKRLDKQKNELCRIGNNGFIFAEGYYFKYGYMKGKQVLPYSIISEIRKNTFPVSALINNNEIIFLKGLEREKILELAVEKNIPVTSPLDNWSLILEKFLDTDFDEDEKEKTRALLENAGIKEEELKKIRRKVMFVMYLATYFSMEWVYYGQFDLLRQMIPSEKKYWWTMEIALK